MQGWPCVAVACALAGCTEHPLKDVEYPPPVGDHGHGLEVTINRDVDILFVIDNSASMGEEQAALARAFGSLLDVLEDPEVAANHRLGITTTDNGNPWCPSTTPEAGALRLSSCRSRLHEFVADAAVPIDVAEEACLALCPEQWSEIEVQPTAVSGSSALESRPWIESIEGRSNLPEGLATVQALQCLGPQGIDGCGYEAPLESMWKALRRSGTDGAAAYGFLRPNAILSVVHVTDEDDCSYDAEWESIFLPEGNRVFWSDPEAASPTSAVCWNAGVACEGTGTYDDCRAIDRDVEGNEVSAEDADELAVLRPVSRYIDILQQLEDHKRTLIRDQEVLVAVIGGVQADGSVTYADAADDPQFQVDFGIGPGCRSATSQAVPPVRLRELAEAFAVDDQPAMFSVCEGDYSPALEAIAQAIADQIGPACIFACVADSDPTTPDVLDPSCTLTQTRPNADGTIGSLEVPPCEDDDTLPDGQDVCYATRTGDELHEECADRGLNLEFLTVRREGSHVPVGTRIHATCELSQEKSLDCPGLL